jgi:hypothetical protein
MGMASVTTFQAHPFGLFLPPPALTNPNQTLSSNGFVGLKIAIRQA